ncbi:hypothetical protein MMU07_14220 [Aquiflexum sp. LQ15W]|uniref:hypothetical protein n=1 Tax=Cognataquiflexum nitidum TaxID=2922272 RepID=UPI001F129DF1|nr:hypothetical protein [Cognataquiflexum nitidum]MCH6200737.1 hypothetical protein [Cognataquiflexum nitidum]
MEKKNYKEMTDAELLVEKNKLKKSKIFQAATIGFLAGIIPGIVGWIISGEKRLGFIILLLIPIFLIYRLFKNPKGNRDLEEVLKERILN